MQTQQVNGISGGLFYKAKSTSAKSSENSFDQLIQMSQRVNTTENNTQKSNEIEKKNVDTNNNTKKAEQKLSDVPHKAFKVFMFF